MVNDKLAEWCDGFEISYSSMFQLIFCLSLSTISSILGSSSSGFQNTSFSFWRKPFSCLVTARCLDEVCWKSPFLLVLSSLPGQKIMKVDNLTRQMHCLMGWAVQMCTLAHFKFVLGFVWVDLRQHTEKFLCNQLPSMGLRLLASNYWLVCISGYQVQDSSQSLKGGSPASLCYSFISQFS